MHLHPATRVTLSEVVNLPKNMQLTPLALVNHTTVTNHVSVHFYKPPSPFQKTQQTEVWAKLFTLPIAVLKTWLTLRGGGEGREPGSSTRVGQAEVLPFTIPNKKMLLQPHVTD